MGELDPRVLVAVRGVEGEGNKGEEEEERVAGAGVGVEKVFGEGVEPPWLGLPPPPPLLEEVGPPSPAAPGV